MVFKNNISKKIFSAERSAYWHNTLVTLDQVNYKSKDDLFNLISDTHNKISWLWEIKDITDTNDTHVNEISKLISKNKLLLYKYNKLLKILNSPINIKRDYKIDVILNNG